MERIKITDEFIEKTMPAMAILDFDQARKVVDAVADAQLTADRAELEKVVREIEQSISSFKFTDSYEVFHQDSTSEIHDMDEYTSETCRNQILDLISTIKSKYISQEE